MKAILSLFLFLFSCLNISSQDLDSLNKSIIKHIPSTVQIIGLGDPTHQEATITSYRIDLIKKLVIEKDYSIIAIEGNLLELYTGYQQFLKDSSSIHIKDAMYPMMNIAEMEELYDFIWRQHLMGKKIKLIGFDPVISGKTYSSIVADHLINNELLNDQEKTAFRKALTKTEKNNFWALFRNNKALRNTISSSSKKILKTMMPQAEGDFFFQQSLNNLLHLYGTEESQYKRDLAMADNIDFLLKAFPNEKIILFGSSTHLLKEPMSIKSRFHQSGVRLLGSELYQKFKKSYYFIGYSAYSGDKWKIWNKQKPLSDTPIESIEFQLLNENNTDAIFIERSLEPEIEHIQSRFLGHYFMSMDIWKVMDMLVVIKCIQPAKIIN